MPEKFQSKEYLEKLNNNEDDTIITSVRPTLDSLPLDGIDMKQYVSDIEISLIEQALSETDNVVARAATILKLRRTTLVEKMRKYDIARID